MVTADVPKLLPRLRVNALVNYHWPGNVRELQNVLERAVILSNGRVLRVRQADLISSRSPVAPLEIETLETAERRHILGVLKHTNWTVSGRSGAAAILGMKRTTLQAKMRRLRIQRPSRDA